MVKVNLSKIEQMVKVANFILNAKTSDEIDSVLTGVAATGEDINLFLDLIKKTNPADAQFVENRDNPRFYVNQVIYAPYYKTNVDIITGSTYRTIVYKKAVITAVSRDFYSNYPFYNEFLYTVRYADDSTSRGNILEHVICLEDPTPQKDK